MSKPTVVVLGGLGFLGRRMVEHLVRENLADAIRVVDKAVKQTAYLDAAAGAVFTDPRVTVIQANLSSEAGAGKALAPFPGDRQPEFVFNLAGESKYGQDDTAYTKGIVELTRLCATAAKAAGVRMFIQVSTAQVCLAPFTRLRSFKPSARFTAAPLTSRKRKQQI
jgi:nucleoside-diphosphate-sugar epimerase